MQNEIAPDPVRRAPRPLREVGVHECNRNHDRALAVPAQELPELVLPRSGYRVRLGECCEGAGQGDALLHRMYAWRGYSVPYRAGGGSRGRQVTFEALDSRVSCGTLTLTLDGDGGLAADELYGRELAAFRGPGRRLVELTRLAIAPRDDSRELLAALFHLAFIYGRILHRATDLFIEVNPRHVRFYERMLGLRRTGPRRLCRRVNAPAVLMRGDLEYVEGQIASFGGGKGRGRSRSLYPHFLSPDEQARLLDPLWHHRNGSSG